MTESIVLLGSTGSIGKQTLEVARAHNIVVRALAAKANYRLLAEQARLFCAETVCIFDEAYYKELKLLLADTEIKILCGMEGLKETAAIPCDFTVNSVVGMIGLEPTLAALDAGNNIALANKETLVAGGEIVMRRAKEKGLRIIPIDSEHSAIFQCLAGNTDNRIAKIILTASGGAFYGYDRERLRCVTKESVLRHPNWSMGDKITVDSQTLMNKGLEFIEAVRLFDVDPDRIEVVIHRQSVVHSAVEFEDGSVMAQLGVPDMRVPIQYALTAPKRLPSPAKKLSLTETGSLTFEKPDYEVFGCLSAAIRAVKLGGTAPVVVNSANEEAVAAFLADKISFSDISALVCAAAGSIKSSESAELESIFETDSAAREFVKAKI